MNKILSLILCVVLLLGLTACVAEDTPYVPTGDALADEDADVNATMPDTNAEPQEFSLAYYAERTMNPIVCTDYTNRTLFSLIYQGLFSTNRDNVAVPMLCDRYAISSDYRTYTFYLREDATYSDGSKVTIEDVLASYQAAKGSKYYGGRFMLARDISLSDDGGITFSMYYPYEDLPLLLDVPIIKASQIEEDYPVGTGPYILEKGISGAQLRRNFNWWCREDAKGLVVTAEFVPLVAAESTTHIRDQFEFADVGVVCANPGSDAYADYRCDYELWECDTGIMLYLGVNVAYSQKDIFLNPDLRTTLTYAIDREQIATDFYRDFAMPATLAVSPNSPYYNKSLAERYSYDPVKFISALGKAPKTEEPIKFMVNKDDSLRLRVARKIKTMLEECGMEIELLEYDTRKFNSQYYAGKYDMYLGQTKLSPNMDLSVFFHPYGNLSFNSTSNQAIYELCLDALENKGNYYNLHKAVADDGRIVPIVFLNYAVYANRGLVTNLEPARDNIFCYHLGRTDADALIPSDYGSVG